MHDYRRLRIYQLAGDLAVDMYAATRRLPRDERFGLRSQMNRAAVSILSNIAEGAGRGGDAEFARFLRIARASACELESQTMIAGRLSYLGEAEAATLRDRIEHVKAGITKLERSLTDRHR